MSKERLGFDIEREMKHLKKIVNKDDSLTISSRFVKYLIEQAERLHGTNHKMGYIDMHADCNRMVGSDSMKIHKLEQQNKELLEDLATIGNAIHEGEISGRGTDENLILEIVDKHWRN